MDTDQNAKYRKLKILVPLALVSLIVGVVIGAYCEYCSLGKKVQSGVARPVRQSGYKFTSPLLECEMAQSILPEILVPFKEKTEVLVNKELRDPTIRHISVYYRDLNNGPWFGIGEKTEFTPSSLLKVPIMMAYLKLAEFDPIILKRIIRFDAVNSEGEDSILVTGKDYTVEELIYTMIINSDNGAAIHLMKNISRDYLDNTYRDIGLETLDPQRPENFMSVKKYASFFRILFNASYLNREMSEKALSILSKGVFKEGLVAGVPQNVVVAHKYGEHFFMDAKQGQLHDCGIVYYPNRPYLLCVMTRGEDVKKLESVIKDISRLIYEKTDEQYRK